MTSEPDIVDLVVWLTDDQVSELARLLLVDDEVGASRWVASLAPGADGSGGALATVLGVRPAELRDALLDEARFRELVRPTGGAVE